MAAAASPAAMRCSGRRRPPRWCWSPSSKTAAGSAAVSSWSVVARRGRGLLNTPRQALCRQNQSIMSALTGWGANCSGMAVMMSWARRW